MIDKAELIRELNLAGFTPEEEEAIYQDFTYELGAALSDGLEEAQMDEFNRIISGDSDVITHWLEANEPQYRDDPEYQDLEVGYKDDPEKVPADKVYASIKWVARNRPDFQQVYERVKREYKASLESSEGA